MKSSHTALGVVGLAIAGLWFAGGGTTVSEQSLAAAEQIRVSEPVAHDNLTVFFIHGRDAVASGRVATLQEALEAGWAVVHETESVNQLSVENRSTEYELFIQEGDIIKGGKQDRMIAIDMLLPPGSGVVPFPAHCVEQGRWTGRGSEAATHFQKSSKYAVGNEIKLANAYGQQSEVWKNVKDNQDKISAKVGERVNAPESATSFQLALENPKLVTKIADYEQALRAAGEGRKSIVGVVFMVNGKVTGADVYGSNAIFQKAWPKLLNSAATEALTEKTEKALPPTPSAREIERYLAVADREESQPVPEAALRQLHVMQPDPSGSVGNALNPTTGNGRATNLNRAPVSNFGAVLLDNEEVRESGNEGRQIQLLNNDIPSSNINPTTTGRSVSSGNRVLTSGGGQALPQQAVNRNLILDTPAIRIENPTAAAANPAGNRLNVNRVDNPSALVTESRDPARQNAVIHKSYIQK